MEKTVEIKKSMAECRLCYDIAEQHRQIPPCENCQGKTGRWVDTVSGFWGTHAIVCMDNGAVEKVPLERLKVIKEESQK